MEKHLSKLTYLIYFSLYSLISYKTSFGFEYSDYVELICGSIAAALISGLIANIVFKISYNLTGFFSALLDFNSDERRSAHWFFRLLFSIPVLIFTLMPLCSMVITPIAHITSVFVKNYGLNLKDQIIDTLTNSVTNLGK